MCVYCSIHWLLSSLGPSTSYAFTSYHRESTSRQARTPNMLWLFFLMEGQSATTGVTPFPPGIGCIYAPSLRREVCGTQVIIVRAAEQATVTPASYPLKPHPQALTHGPDRTARYFPQMLGRKTKLQSTQARSRQCVARR